MSTHKYLDTTGLGQVWGKIKDLIPQPADDIEVINLLPQYEFVSPLADADGYVITDADDNIITV